MKVKLRYLLKGRPDKTVDIPDVDPTPRVIFDTETKNMHVLDNIGNTYIYKEVPYGIYNDGVTVVPQQ